MTQVPDRWHVIRVFAGVEFDVEARIASDGWEVFCPSFVDVRRNRYGHRGDTIEVKRPLFAGYLFAKVGDGFRPQAFERSRTKLRVFYKKTLTQGQLDAVRATADAATEANKRPTVRKLQPGDFAELLRGLLRGERAEILQIKGSAALLQMMRGGRTAIVKVPVADLARVSRVAN